MVDPIIAVLNRVGIRSPKNVYRHVYANVVQREMGTHCYARLMTYFWEILWCVAPTLLHRITKALPELPDEKTVVDAVQFMGERNEPA